jgi:tetratricopeptide (TPR) repeat protein
MAPEQARGETDQVDERADVFALGSILCEILTGEPAFLGRSAREIARKAALGDTVDALNRLASSGADAELVVLAKDCLAAEAEDRPRNASIVADRIAEHLAGVQNRLRAAELARAAESARAEEATRTAAEADQRARAERRARRFQVGLAASLLVLTTAGGLAFTYLLQQRQAEAARRDQALAETTTLLKRAKGDAVDPVPWRDALAALDRVEGHAPDPRTELLRAEIQAGLDQAERIGKLRQGLVEARASGDAQRPGAADSAYLDAFGAAELNLDALGPAELARRMRTWPAAVAVEAAAYMDDWSAARRNAHRPIAQWRRPMEAARLLDPDPYRDRLRAILLVEDRRSQAGALKQLASDPSAAELSAPTAVLLGQALSDAGEAAAAAALLRPSVLRHPEDVWTNYALGRALVESQPREGEEAVRYYTAARAIRPETAHQLAHLLSHMGRHTEAEAVYRDLIARRPENPQHPVCLGDLFLNALGKPADAAPFLNRAVATARAAIRLRPDDAQAHENLGYALAYLNKPEEAIAEYREAIRLDPDLADAYHNLGRALIDTREFAAAVTAFRQSLRLSPDSAVCHNCLGTALGPLGKCDEAVAEFREAIRLAPDETFFRTNLGVGLANMGKLDEAVATLREVIRIQPNAGQVRGYLAEMLASQGKFADAAAEARERVRLHPESEITHNFLGQMLAKQGKRDEAIAELRTAVQLRPDFPMGHLNLANVLRDQGDYAGSLAELRKARELGSKQPGWSATSDLAIRQAETLVAMADRLPAILKGSQQPRDNAERLAVFGLCFNSKRYAQAVRHLEDALRNDPKLADDSKVRRRYNGARAAALAASGSSQNEPPLDDAARAKLRAQALGWLKAELAAWTKAVDSDPKSGPTVITTLQQWKIDPNLAAIRETKALEKLPESDRKEWQTLWAEVDGLQARLSGRR